MKRILFFFPSNPLDKNEGCKIRALNLLKYFRERSFCVDYVGLDYWDNWNEENVASMQSQGLAEKVYLLKEEPVMKNNTFKYSSLFRSKKRVKQELTIPDHTPSYLKEAFEQILANQHYDAVIISYAYWANLIKDSAYLDNTKTIIDTHDLLTSQHQKDENLSVGLSLEEELRRLSLFNEIWVISSDEQYIFSQFLKQKVTFIPMMFDAQERVFQAKEFDIIYVASDNTNNINSITWFLNHVYPLLPAGVRICIIGKITEHIHGDYAGITMIPFVSDLTDHYRKSKIAICPMLAGTGIKVKVIEALSFGLPVVGTQRAIDGMPNKINNGCLISDDPVRFAGYVTTLLTDDTFYSTQSKLASEIFMSAFVTDKCYEDLDESLRC
ncbi:glycosyltransferase [Pararcticibacter amylolyticus]|uniref:Glycosyl transferase family 1 n=1 Tax=Pararcticibacter amylolyticus TaxID=2173175 RepID=A0A2U2PI22_9SPHI|nr:glycosyltransferase [Pararcticibacter amylolyticus]PWG81057.1 hypothetical protein DDR33_09020 [Pararcticibacter amylolyticus]